MGESRAFAQSILGEYTFIAEDDCPSARSFAAFLYSFNAEKFIYVHTYAFCYNKCKINPTLEAALMIAKTKECIRHDY
jgi:hypothetical protein